MIVDVKQAAVGKWASVLNSLGIDQKHFSGRHGPCPQCGGKDRFRWSRAKEWAHCNQCGSMSAMDLAIAYTGKPFKELAIEIKPILGHVKMTTTPEFKNDEIEKNKARLQAIHKGLSSLSGSCPASTYIASRGLSVLPEKDSYYHSGVPYYEDGNKIGQFNSIVSVFRNANGETCSYHITYLSDDGKTKRDISVPKKILPAIRPLAGSSIKLFNPVNGVLAVAEGIETALAVHQLEGVPVWATGNAQLMSVMEFPEDLKELWIYADSDANYTGQKAAYTLANRAALKGIKTRVCIIQDGEKWLTDRGVKADFLDYLLLQKEAA